MKKTIVTIMLLSATMMTNAQALKFSDIYLYGNSGNTTAGPISTSESVYLRSNLSTSNIQNVKMKSGTSRYSNGIGIMAGWNIRSKKKSNLQQKLRTGVSFGNYSLNYDGIWNQTTTTTIDTFVSQNTGDKIYVDSVFNQTAYVSHNATMVNLDASYIVTLNAQRKLSFITGVGASLGFSLQNTINSSYHEISFIKNYIPNYSHSNNFINPVNETNSKSLPMATNFKVYVPIGLNYRLSNRSPFLKHVNLFSELNLGLDLNKMDGIKTNLGFYSSLNTGVRISMSEMGRAKSNDNQYKRRRRNY